MNQESMVKALQAIYEEAERLRKAALPTEVAEGLDLIMSIARRNRCPRVLLGIGGRATDMRQIGIGVIFIVRLLLALVAVWQVLGLLPVFTWFSSPASVTVGMWFMVGIKCVILLLCLLFFWLLGRLSRRIRHQPVQVAKHA